MIDLVHCFDALVARFDAFVEGGIKSWLNSRVRCMKGGRVDD